MQVKPEGLIVVKVGGSLYDLPDLGPRLRSCLQSLAPASVLLVPGGGSMADVIRRFDEVHRLGEEKAHWLALRALSLNAAFLKELLPQAHLVSDSSERHLPLLAILDAHAFAIHDEGRPGALPHLWHATSDAVAARAAVVGQAAGLVLLKSITIPPEVSWDEASQRGWVDRFFPQVLLQATRPLRVWSVNLRKWRSVSGGR